MKKILLSILALSFLNSCDLFSSGEESSEEKQLKECLESIRTAPQIKVSKYFVSNGQKVSFNADNGRILVFIENKPRVWKINHEFTPARSHDFDKPVSGFISPKSNSINPMGLEMVDSVYQSFNSTPGNSWIPLDLITPTSNSQYTLTVKCECENGATSPETIINFKSVRADQVHPGIIARAEITRDKYKAIISSPFGHQLGNYLSSDMRVYAITTKKDGQGRILHQFRYDFTDDIFNGAIPLRSFTEITNLPANDQYVWTHIINTKLFAESKKTDKILYTTGDDWPFLSR